MKVSSTKKSSGYKPMLEKQVAKNELKNCKYENLKC